MFVFDDLGKSLVTRLRALHGRHFRTLALGAFLLGSAWIGIPIRPEEIEEHLHGATKAQLVQVLEEQEREADSAGP